MTPRLKKLLVECHPDRHGGDHSQMEKFYTASQGRIGTLGNENHCVDCGVTVKRAGRRCMVCHQKSRRQTKAQLQTTS